MLISPALSLRSGAVAGLVIPGAMNKFADLLGQFVFPRTFAAKLATSVMAKAITRR
jgi:hypothetical protein